MLRQMTPNWSKFTDACMRLPIKPTGYFPCEQGWGDELCLMTKLPGTYTGDVVRGRGFGTMQRSARFINNAANTLQINYQNLTTWNVGSQGSFCGWIRANQQTDWILNSIAVVMARGSSPDSFTDRTVNLYISGGVARFRIFRGSNAHLCSGVNTLEIGKWYFISGSYIQGSLVQLYVNGIAEGSTGAPANFSINNPNNRVLRIGNDGSSGANVWNNDYEVMHCALWTSLALTEVQWRKLYSEAFASPLAA